MLWYVRTLHSTVLYTSGRSACTATVLCLSNASWDGLLFLAGSPSVHSSVAAQSRRGGCHGTPHVPRRALIRAALRFAATCCSRLLELCFFVTVARRLRLRALDSEGEGFVAGPVLSRLPLECVGVGTGTGTGMPTWACISHCQAEQAISLGALALSQPASGQQRRTQANTGRARLEHCFLQGVSSQLTAS